MTSQQSVPCRGSILIVDDSPINLRVLSNALLEHGYDVRCVKSGPMALMGAQSAPPDLLLLDIRMPDMDGYTVCQQLKANPKTQGIPVIFLSALDDALDKVKAFAVGAVDYITKPFQVEEVLARVTNQLTIRRLQQQLIEQNQQLQQEIFDRKQAEANLYRTTSALADFSNSLKHLHRLNMTPFDSFQTLFQDYLQTGCEVLSFTGGLIGVVDGESYIVKAVRSDLQGLVPDLRCPLKDTLCGRAIELQETVTYAHLGMMPEMAKHPIYQAFKLESYIGTPILVGGEVYGSLCFFSQTPRLGGFKSHEREIIELMAQSMGKVIGTHLLEQKRQQAETDLRRSEERWQLAIQGNYDGIFDIDFRTQKTFFSKRFKEILGYAEDEIADDELTWSDRIHPDDYLRVMAINQAYLVDRILPSYMIEYRLRSKDGSYKWVLSRGQALWDEAGQPVRLVGATGDISDRKQAEEALRQSEERFRQLAENIDSVFWMVDPTQNRLIYVSPAYEEIWGRSRQLLYEDFPAFLEAIHPEDWDRIQAALPKQIQGHYDEEYRILRPNQEVRWIRDRAFPIYNEAGKVYRIVGIAEDITELKRQDQALRLIVEGTAATTGSEFFQSLVRHLASVLQVRYALVGQLQGINSNRFKTLAFWQGQQLGDNFEAPLEGTPNGKVMARELYYCPQNVQTQFPQDVDLARLRAESYLGIPLINSAQEVVGYLAVLDDHPMVEDQTRELILRIFAARAGAELERKQVEDAIQQARETADAANRAKSEFLANMSHELRTPLNTILGFTQLIMRECTLAPRAVEYLDIVSRSGEHLLELINDVLEMSKIEAGRASLNPSSFDLHYLLSSLEEMLRLRASSQGLTLSFDCAPDLPQAVETDEGKLRQVLINLLGNAIKFTQTGRVILRVRAESLGTSQNANSDLSVPDEQLWFEVEDTGPGIAPEDFDSLFDPFVQTVTGQRAQEGTGLGLPISKRFVHLMGGELTLRTALGQGSTFTFSIPICTRTALPQTAPRVHPRTLKLAPNQPAYRLLVVEDHPANRYLMVRLLETVGFVVQAAKDGQEAIEMAAAWRPHLIWMDIRMPRLDGYGATRAIKAANLSPVPVIIALTASAFEEERTRILAAGCDDFVSKPFRADAILKKVAQHLSVEYLYETPQPSSEVRPSLSDPLQSAPTCSLTALQAALPYLPGDWLQSLQRAAVTGSDERILQLVEQLPDSQSDLAQTLTTWAKVFQFDAILDFLQTVEI